MTTKGDAPRRRRPVYTAAMTRGSCLLFAAWHAVAALAGGGPQNVLVVVNDSSPDSLELGRHYAAARGIPPRQVCHVSVATNFSMSWPVFTNAVRDPVLRFLGAQGLSNQIDYIVFARDIPYRIFTNAIASNQHAGLTATMFYGFFTSPDAFVAGCDLAPGSDNPYFGAERSFRHDAAPSGNRLYPSTLLTGFTLDQSKRLVDRAVAGDGAAPAATFHFLHTSDLARNVQWPHFEPADFLVRSVPTRLAVETRDANTLGGVSDVAGYLTGFWNVADVTQNGYIAGAFGEHLTSFGGFLFDSGHMSILEWIRAGVAGSYGTVVEPCNYTEKFTDPVFAYWYARGFNLAESQYQSVRHPYQGVLVADPLAAPYATNAPLVTLGGIGPGAVVSNTVTLSVTGTAAAAGARVSRIDLFLDGCFLATLTNVGPTVGNLASITAGGITSSYTVLPGDDLFAVAAGLANAVNLAPGPFRATNSGDRVVLVQTNFGSLGSGVALGSSAHAGLASELTVGGLATTTNFLDPVYPARRFIAVHGIANSGDVVRLTVTPAGGTAVTNEIVAAQDETALSVILRLTNAVNTDAALQATNGVVAKYVDHLYGVDRVEAVLEARTPGPVGWSNVVDLLVTPVTPGAWLSNSVSFTDHLNDNAVVLRPRGTVLLTAGRPVLAASYALDTTALPDGPHELLAVACEGSAVAEQGRVVMPFSVTNHSLACAIVPSTRTVAWGAGFTVDVTTATGAGPVTQLVLFVEGKTGAVLAASSGTFAVGTTGLGAGEVIVQARADTGGGASVLSRATHVTVFTDRDGDGMSDQWEYVHFGSETNATGSADADGDGVANGEEYFADTVPTDASSFLAIASASRQSNGLAVVHAARTTRVYRLQVTDSVSGTWQPHATNFVAPASNAMTWLDAATNALRTHRIEVRLP